MMHMAKPIPILMTGLLTALLQTGCFWVTTKHEGQKLRADVIQLETRLTTREESLQGKIQELERVLGEATQLLKRNSADLGADFESLSEQVRVLQGLVTAAKNHAEEVRKEVVALQKSVDNDREVLARRLESLEQRIAELEGQARQPATPQSPNELYAEGKAAFDAGDSARARSLFQQMVTRFPSHDRADDAQYYRGETYFREKDYDSAIREFQKVFDKYKDSSLADDALFRAGEAAQALRRCSEARAYFGLLRQKYPKSSLDKKAQDKDKELKRDAKNKAKCTS
jgi:tol-pal system protein YbgF